jgi:hypothetical protein
LQVRPLGLWIADAQTATLVEEVRLPRRASEAIRIGRRKRAREEATRNEARASTVRAARTLVNDLHLGLRDAAELLGLSHQRVQQLVRH